MKLVTLMKVAWRGGAVQGRQKPDCRTEMSTDNSSKSFALNGSEVAGRRCVGKELDLKQMRNLGLFKC